MDGHEYRKRKEIMNGDIFFFFFFQKFRKCAYYDEYNKIILDTILRADVFFLNSFSTNTIHIRFYRDFNGIPYLYYYWKKLSIYTSCLFT